MLKISGDQDIREGHACTLRVLHSNIRILHLPVSQRRRIKMNEQSGLVPAALLRACLQEDETQQELPSSCWMVS